MGIGWLELTIVLLATVVWFGMLVAVGMGVWALLSWPAVRAQELPALRGRSCATRRHPRGAQPSTLLDHVTPERRIGRMQNLKERTDRRLRRAGAAMLAASLMLTFGSAAGCRSANPAGGSAQIGRRRLARRAQPGGDRAAGRVSPGPATRRQAQGHDGQSRSRCQGHQGRIGQTRGRPDHARRQSGPRHI